MTMVLLRRVSTQYMRLLETHPIKTKSITSGVIAGAGDATCQYLQRTDDDDTTFNWRRFANFTAIGGFYVGPLLHTWYSFLMRTIPGSTTRAIAS